MAMQLQFVVQNSTGIAISDVNTINKLDSKSLFNQWSLCALK